MSRETCCDLASDMPSDPLEEYVQYDRMKSELKLSSLQTHLDEHMASLCYGNVKINAMREIMEALSEINHKLNMLVDCVEKLDQRVYQIEGHVFPERTRM